MIPYAIRWFDSAAESKERTVCSATEEFEMLCWTMIYDNHKLKDNILVLKGLKS